MRAFQFRFKFYALWPLGEEEELQRKEGMILVINRVQVLTMKEAHWEKGKI